jgi:Phosphopantetheinyl transferase component of siderophore synthetase
MISVIPKKGGHPCIDACVKQYQESSWCLDCQIQKNRSISSAYHRSKARMNPPSFCFVFAFTFVASMGLINSFSWSVPSFAPSSSRRILSFTTRFKPLCENRHSRKRRFIISANVANDPNQFISDTAVSSCESGLNFSFPKVSIYTERLATLHTSAANENSNLSTLEHAVHGHNSHTTSSVESHTSCATAVPNMYEHLFSLDLPEGKCVGLRLTHPNQAPTVPTSLDPSQIRSNKNHWIKEILHPDEVEYGFQQPSESARITFFIGRLAMRTALAQMKDIDSHVSVEYEDRLGGFTKLPVVSTNDQSILKDEHGRPKVPNGFIGSISHKQNTAVALVSTLPSGNDQGIVASPTIGVGVDIEQSFTRRRNIAKKILTPNELDDLGKLEGVTRDEEVLLRFSLKESVYKAMHPLICQFVGFQEAEITPHNNGTATVYLNLRSGQHNRFKEVKAHWRRIDGDFFLTSSSVTLKEC